jgi:hypothetical protein
MYVSRLAAAITAVLFSALLSTLPARADFIFDLTVSGNWTGSGSIDFTTQSGSSTVDVAGFSFHVATSGGSAGAPQDYALADINTISWSIDQLRRPHIAASVPLDPIRAYIRVRNCVDQ